MKDIYCSQCPLPATVTGYFDLQMNWNETSATTLLWRIWVSHSPEIDGAGMAAGPTLTFSTKSRHSHRYYSFPKILIIIGAVSVCVSQKATDFQYDFSVAVSECHNMRHPHTLSQAKQRYIPARAKWVNFNPNNPPCKAACTSRANVIIGSEWSELDSFCLHVTRTHY